MERRLTPSGNCTRGNLHKVCPGGYNIQSDDKVAEDRAGPDLAGVKNAFEVNLSCSGIVG